MKSLVDVNDVYEKDCLVCGQRCLYLWKDVMCLDCVDYYFALPKRSEEMSRSQCHLYQLAKECVDENVKLLEGLNKC